MRNRDLTVPLMLGFFCITAAVFTLATIFSPEFRAGGAAVAGLILGNIAAVIGTLAGFRYGQREARKTENEEDRR